MGHQPPSSLPPWTPTHSSVPLILPPPTPPPPLASTPPQIIHINLTSESPQPLTAGAALTFTYSVQWKASSIPFVRRFERYLDFNFFEHQVLAGGAGRW